MKMLNIFNWVTNLVEAVTFYGGGSGGGSAPTTQTVNQVSIPPELMPYATSTLAAAKGQLFNTDKSGNITGIKPSNLN